MIPYINFFCQTHIHLVRAEKTRIFLHASHNAGAIWNGKFNEKLPIIIVYSGGIKT